MQLFHKFDFIYFTYLRSHILKALCGICFVYFGLYKTNTARCKQHKNLKSVKILLYELFTDFKYLDIFLLENA